jgi:hypothetical protein
MWSEGTKPLGIHPQRLGDAGPGFATWGADQAAWLRTFLASTFR